MVGGVPDERRVALGKFAIPGLRILPGEESPNSIGRDAV